MTEQIKDLGETLTLGGWEYVRHSDSLNNHMHLIAEELFDKTYEEYAEGEKTPLVQAILKIDELFLEGAIRQALDDARQAEWEMHDTEQEFYSRINNKSAYR